MNGGVNACDWTHDGALLVLTLANAISLSKPLWYDNWWNGFSTLLRPFFTYFIKEIAIQRRNLILNE